VLPVQLLQHIGVVAKIKVVHTLQIWEGKVIVFAFGYWLLAFETFARQSTYEQLRVKRFDKIFMVDSSKKQNFML
jgi:hypothetical protein